MKLSEWIDKTAWDKRYWSDIYLKQIELKSDGCSGVPDWMIWTCWEHDIHYRTHKTIDGQELTKSEADYIFRRRIQQSSGFGFFSPVSWGRWLGLAVIFRHKSNKAWNAHVKD